MKTKVGSIVSIPWWEYSCIGGSAIMKRKGVPNLIGRITKIDGVYHYIKVLK